MRSSWIGRALIAAGLFGVACVASADVCSVYTNVSDGGSAVATPSVLNRTNVSLNGTKSDDCAGHYDLGASSLASSVSIANSASGFSSPGLFGHGDWLGAAKVDPNGAESEIWGGLKFELVSVSGFGTAGTFTLKVTDVNGSAPNNLPATMDFAIMLSKGQGINDFYFFNDEVVNTSNSGVFTVGFTNDPGGSNAQPSLQDLSHINLLVRDIRSGPLCQPNDPNCQGPSIPEPGSLALAALALAGLGHVARRRRQR